MNERKSAILVSLGSYLCSILFLYIFPLLGGFMLLLTGIYVGKKSENFKWRGL